MSGGHACRWECSGCCPKSVLPRVGSQCAVFDLRRPTQPPPGFPRPVSLGFPSGSQQQQRVVGSWDTAFPVVWEEASPAEREQSRWAGLQTQSCKAEKECQAETCSPKFRSAWSHLPERCPTHLPTPPPPPCPCAWTVGCPAEGCCSGHQLGGWAWAPGLLGSERFEGCQCFILLGMFF